MWKHVLMVWLLVPVVWLSRVDQTSWLIAASLLGFALQVVIFIDFWRIWKNNCAKGDC